VDSQGIVQADMIITNVGTVATVNPLFIRYTDCQTNNTSSPDVQCVSRSFLSIAFGRVSENLQPGQSVRLIRPFRKRRLTDTFVIITATIDPNLSYITNINSQPSDRPEGFIRNPIFCNEISTTANCERLQFSSENGDITVEGLTTSYSKIEIIGRNTDYQVLTICDGDCAETQVIPDLANGDYTVKVNLSDDEGNFCYREENVTITNSSSNRDSKLDYDKVFRLFPNPAKDQLYLKFQQGIDEQGTVRIYNAFGQLIQALPNISFQGEAVEVDLTGYENGMYWLSVQVKGRAIIGRRFVVEHLR